MVTPFQVSSFFAILHFVTYDSFTGYQCNWVFFVAVPYQAPNNFSVTAETSTSVIVSLQPPSKRKITGYKVFYRKQGSQNFSTNLTISSAVTETTVTKLLKYTEYEFEVQTFNDFGDGPKSVHKVVRTKEDGKRSEIGFSTTLFM